jgi:hypothetical protein
MNFCPTTELSDAGGPARPKSQRTWPVRIRSSDFVGLHIIFLQSMLLRRNAGTVSVAIGRCHGNRGTHGLGV